MTWRARTLAELDAWLSLNDEPVLEPHLPIIDAHHHMWERPPERYGFDALTAELERGGHAIASTVFMECTAFYRADGPEILAPVGEVEWVNGVAAQSASGVYGPTRLCRGIVGRAELTLGAAVRETLQAQVETARDRFRGVRYQTQNDPHIGSLARRTAPFGLLGDANFREGYAELEPMGLSFDAWVYFSQLGEVADLADAFPAIPIILDHSGGPLGVGPYADRRDEVFAGWSASLKDLAQRPNVSLKVGGMGMTAFGFGFELGDRPPSSVELVDAWRPYVETCIEAFGPARCMLESNFPVDKQSFGYREMWNAFKRLTRNFSDSERTDLFGGSAERIYRLT